MRKHGGGFTLVELLIALVIVGLLAAIAIPSYSKFVKRGARSDAKAQMLNLAQMEERYYSNSAGSTTAAAYLVVPAAPATNTTGWQNYSGGNSVGARKYSIGVAVTGQTYTITATPDNGYVDPDCGWLTLTSDGIKSSQYSNTTCW
jgi:type IV pilus assembly protein PilE